MPSPAIILSFLVGGMLLTALLMVSRMRLASLVGLFRIQAILLGLYALETPFGSMKCICLSSRRSCSS